MACSNNKRFCIYLTRHISGRVLYWLVLFWRWCIAIVRADYENHSEKPT